MDVRVRVQHDDDKDKDDKDGGQHGRMAALNQPIF